MGTGQEPTLFVGRTVELNKFKRNLRDTYHGKPKNLAIVGDYGSGKTVLMWKFQKYATENNACPIFVQAYTVKTFKDFYNLLLNEIVKVFPKSGIKKFRERLTEIGLSVVGSGLTMQLQKEDFEPQSALSKILENTYDSLKKKNENIVIVILIDDMHLIAQSLERQVLEILRNVFTDLSRKQLRIMITVSGTKALFPELEKMHEAIVRFFEPKQLLPFTPEETTELIVGTLKKVDVSCDMKLIKLLHELSEGSPYFVQLLGYHLFEYKENKRITRKSLNKGLNDALAHLAVTKFRNMYEMASDEEKKVLYALFKLGRESSFTTIVKKAKKLGVAERTAGTLIRRLYTEKQLLRKTQTKYDFTSKMFRLWLNLEKPFKTDGII